MRSAFCKVFRSLGAPKNATTCPHGAMRCLAFTRTTIVIEFETSISYSNIILVRNYFFLKNYVTFKGSRFSQCFILINSPALPVNKLFMLTIINNLSNYQIKVSTIPPPSGGTSGEKSLGRLELLDGARLDDDDDDEKRVPRKNNFYEAPTTCFHPEVNFSANNLIFKFALLKKRKNVYFLGGLMFFFTPKFFDYLYLQIILFN